jgi:hypothetical protein
MPAPEMEVPRSAEKTGQSATATASTYRAAGEVRAVALPPGPLSFTAFQWTESLITASPGLVSSAPSAR